MYQPSLVHYLYAVHVCFTLMYMNMRKPVKTESLGGKKGKKETTLL